MEIITKSAEGTKNLGREIADSVIGLNKNQTIICLSGDLGSGKTTFVQGFAKKLGIIQRIISPTFILLRKYTINSKKNDAGFRNFYHIDLYRLEGNLDKEMQNLGLDEIWSEKSNIVIIEWAEKMKKLIPDSAIWITFKYVSDNDRKINIDNI